jgi:hypothetical protein
MRDPRIRDSMNPGLSRTETKLPSAIGEPLRKQSGFRLDPRTEAKATIAPPNWAIGWDVFCWTGHRRFSLHMSIPRIQSELLDDYAIKLSDDAIATRGFGETRSSIEPAGRPFPTRQRF